MNNSTIISTVIVDTLNSTSAPKIDEQFTILESLFYLTCGMVGTIFNSMVIWIAMRYIDTEDKPRQVTLQNILLTATSH